MNGEPITPTQFAQELVDAVRLDPGCERKCMLFYLEHGGERYEVRFKGFGGGARCLTLMLEPMSSGSGRETDQLVTSVLERNERAINKALGR